MIEMNQERGPLKRCQYRKCVNLPIAKIATILTTDDGGSHSDTKASTAYWAKDKHIIAICEGFNTNVDTHEKRKAGGAPNASIKYAHSAPDDVFIVPNSAYANAPVIKQIFIFIQFFRIFESVR